MNLINNALSAKNVRIHGMSAPKWTTKDKITQYKGLVNLYKRDRQIIEVDTSVASKRQTKGLQALKKAIEVDRNKLDNAVGGDRQTLRNVLADHKELQLAYQNSDPKKVIENVHQVNFTKRKDLDKLQYQLKLKSQELIDLKLEKSLLEDRLKYAGFDKLKEEKEAQIITGKVQDALLKKEAALAIQQSYIQIIDVMKKDALYFDGILLTIQTDAWYQCRCILNAAKQGQLATEYKHDREQEFKNLETAIVSDMKTQKSDLEEMKSHAETLHSNLKQLLRRDSDLTTCVMKMEETHDVLQLRRDLEKIETTLRILRDTTLVSSFEMIYPSLKEQLRQRRRLTTLSKRCERNRDTIMNKLNHAELMSDMLENTMVETTGEYKKRKQDLISLINAELETQTKNQRSLSLKIDLIAQIRISLRQIQQLCKPVKAPSESKDSVREKILTNEQVIYVPESEEIDGRKIINQLKPKLTYLLHNVNDKLDESKTDDAFKYYERLMENRKIEATVDTDTDESFLDGFVHEASHLLTREDVKRLSAEIVAAHNRDEEFAPTMTVKKKKKF